jgi:hypothetical protein
MKYDGSEIEIKEMTEIELYLAIYSMTYSLWRLQHDYHKGDILENEWEKMSKVREKYNKRIKEAMIRLSVFGIIALDDKNNETKEFKKWYSWWRNWHQSMNDEEWQSISKKIGKEDISNYRPAGKWKEFTY